MELYNVLLFNGKVSSQGDILKKISKPIHFPGTTVLSTAYITCLTSAPNFTLFFSPTQVIREKPKSDYALKSLSSERVVYQKRTKKEYIENLKRAFSVNKYINVVFDEVEVIQHPKMTDIYGVTLKQEWYSDRYSDVGFVFLMIDFQDEYHPLIQVRTWQPEKVGGKVLARDEVFNLGDFNIVRSLVND